MRKEVVRGLNYSTLSAFVYKTEQNQKNPQSGQSVSRPRFEPVTYRLRQKHCRLSQLAR
jgi:hypothetical protein